MSASTLHFVYNVDGTPSALLRDFVHRLVDPETYPCDLEALEMLLASRVEMLPDSRS